MLGAIIAIAVVVLLVVGFWWTRGAGGLPGGADDPARQELRRFDELGDPVQPPGLEREDREHEIE
jgi:FtsZ-interacting cell division protein ZipA